MAKRKTKGTCWVCGCTEQRACILGTKASAFRREPITCSWVHNGQTLCTNPLCIKKAGGKKFENLLEKAMNQRSVSPSSLLATMHGKMTLKEFKAGTQPTEDQEQAALVEHLEVAHKSWLFFAIPNGGQRHPAVAAQLKRAGVKAGVPDLFFPSVVKPYHGLFVEMKRADGGKKRDNQTEWHLNLARAGYAVGICHGAPEALDFIAAYHTNRLRSEVYQRCSARIYQ